jgi:chitinase
MPNEAFGLDWDGSDKAPGILIRLVDVAHQHGKKVKLSVGGWGGSRYVGLRRLILPVPWHSHLRFFSPAVNNSSSRQTFVQNIALVYDQFHLDGIDIDWEYPALRGDPRNYVGANDTANFLEFLRLLRGTLPRTARISAAVQTTPFADATGQPMKDVRPFANVLDWLLIMNYDVWGGVSCIIPSFQLSHQCGCSFVQPWTEWTPKRRLSKLYTANG